MRYLNTILSSTILAALFLLPWAAGGQQPTFNVQGSVCDTAGRAIAGVNVGLWQDTVLRAAAASDSLGSFTLRGVRPGEYRFEAVCLGYATVRQTISVNASLQPLAFAMRERAEEMEAVRVVASRTKVEPDGTLTFQAQNAPVAKGRSTLEMLRFVQGLTVNGSQVLIKGREGTKIFLGDSRKELTPQDLKSIPATEILKIAVESQAGVEHGAGSEGGIIRVYLVPRIGLAGTLEGSLCADGYGSHWDPRLELRLLYNQGRFSTQHDLFYTPYFKYTTLYRYEQFAGADTIRSNYKHVRTTANYLDYNMSLGYEIAKEHSLSLYAHANYVPSDRAAIQDEVLGQRTQRWGEKNRSVEYSAGLEYIWTLPIGEESRFKLWTSYSDERIKGYDVYYADTHMDSAKYQSNDTYVEVAPTLSFKLTSGHKLQGGINFDYSLDEEQKAGVSLVNFARGQSPVKYKESGGDIRPWIQYDKSFWGNRFYLRIGVTGLYYWTTRKNLLDSQKDFNLPTEWGVFPKLFMQWRLNQEKNIYLQGSYSYLYSLPNYFYFSPIVTYVTANQYSVGNSDLRMETIHSAELTLLFLQTWQWVYRVRYIPNQILVVPHADPQDATMSFLRPENAGSSQEHYMEIAYNKSIFDFWFTSNTLYVRYGHAHGANEDTKYIAVGGSTTQNFIFYKGIGMHITFLGSTQKRHLGRLNGPSYALIAALYASFLDDQLQINFSANQILMRPPELTLWYGTSTTHRTEMTRFRNFELRITWSFSHGHEVEDSYMKQLSTPGKVPIQL